VLRPVTRWNMSSIPGADIRHWRSFAGTRERR
jgi:hypothetical protein